MMEKKNDQLYPDVPRTMPNRYEHSFLMHTMICHHALVTNGERVRERMKPYKTFWRDLKLCESLLSKILDQFLRTLPNKRLAYYWTLASQGQITVDIPGPKPKDPLALIDVRMLAPVAEACVKSECALCVKDGKEIKKCPIREGLMTIVPPDKVSDNWLDCCEYQEHAIKLTRGKEVD